VFNPNPYGLTVKRMGLMLKVSDSTLADVNLLQGVRIGGNSEVTVPITIQPSLSTLGNIFMAGVNSFLSKKDQNVMIEGDIIVRKFIFRKRFTIKESLKFH
jgi:LEA14-like dessication related protein